MTLFEAAYRSRPVSRIDNVHRLYLLGGPNRNFSFLFAADSLDEAKDIASGALFDNSVLDIILGRHSDVTGREFLGTTESISYVPNVEGEYSVELTSINLADMTTPEKYAKAISFPVLDEARYRYKTGVHT
jgi:hypothetical protein